jgi:putative peptidoglycan lipid II flippase
MVSIPAMIFTLLMRYEIITLLFKYGKFDDESVRLTAYALMFHISGLFFIAVTRILFPAFFAQEDTVSPTIAGVVSVVVNIIAALILVKTMKGGGVALASTISAFISAVILLLMLRRGGRINIKEVFLSFGYALKFLIISICCGIPVYFLKGYIYNFFANAYLFSGSLNKITTQLFPFTIVTTLFMILLGTTLIIIKDENAQFIVNKLLRRKRNGKS